MPDHYNLPHLPQSRTQNQDFAACKFHRVFFLYVFVLLHELHNYFSESAAKAMHIAFTVD